ncbi:DinB family protein [Alkalicoccus urumqiensis]|uniref:Damage-inducible protein DinB n=1 Tax=Alkalicoccus urumqiensis TaxID=1548213 RepID=A0A2P6MJZ2_ALKUR|nr:DinB family protein [Alkalicoccus urumqiensis]PRO66604.1 hypothetical protein C6I21_04470 [Alkalicoccus urumqiensis]
MMYKNEAYLKNYFLSHRDVTKDLIGMIEKDKYDYRPTPTSMSAKELVVHMLTSFHKFAAIAAGRDPVQLHEENDDWTLNELADRYTEESVRLIEMLDPAKIDEEIDLSQSMGTVMPAWRLIETAIDHEINHKGNLFVYVREMGHTHLPMFVKNP